MAEADNNNTNQDDIEPCDDQIMAAMGDINKDLAGMIWKAGIHHVQSKNRGTIKINVSPESVRQTYELLKEDMANGTIKIGLENEDGDHITFDELPTHSTIGAIAASGYDPEDNSIWIRRGTLLKSSPRAQMIQEQLDNGLLKGHGYSIVGDSRYKMVEGKEYEAELEVLRIRRPEIVSDPAVGDSRVLSPMDVPDSVAAKNGGNSMSKETKEEPKQAAPPKEEPIVSDQLAAANAEVARLNQLLEQGVSDQLAASRKEAADLKAKLATFEQAQFDAHVDKTINDSITAKKASNGEIPKLKEVAAKIGDLELFDSMMANRPVIFPGEQGSTQTDPKSEKVHEITEEMKKDPKAAKMAKAFRLEPKDLIGGDE